MPHGGRGATCSQADYAAKKFGAMRQNGSAAARGLERRDDTGTVAFILDQDRLSQVCASARALGAQRAAREVCVDIPQPLARRRGTRWWRRLLQNEPQAAIIRLPAGELADDARIAAELGQYNLTRDPETLLAARDAYREGFDAAMGRQIDTFIRGCMGT